MLESFFGSGELSFPTDLENIMYSDFYLLSEAHSFIYSFIPLTNIYGTLCMCSTLCEWWEYSGVLIRIG